MPNIIPNWHPAAVHFPIALAITATLLLLLGRWRPERATYTASGRLLVLGAALSAVLAAMLGWFAFATVEHDGAGHRVMLTHRTWALVATVGLIAVAIWDGLREGADRPPHGALLPIMVVLSACLVVTGWLGAEMVYRHGVGVSAAAFAAPEAPPPPAMVQPEVATPAIVTPPVAPASVTETPALAPGEHIHRDGKRHRH